MVAVHGSGRHHFTSNFAFDSILMEKENSSPWVDSESAPSVRYNLPSTDGQMSYPWEQKGSQPHYKYMEAALKP